MKPFAGMIASIGATSPTFEAATFAQNLVPILKAAKINASLDANVNAEQEGLILGVMAHFTTGNKKGEAFADAVAAALTDEGIAASASGGLFEALFGARAERDASQAGPGALSPGAAGHRGAPEWERNDPRLEWIRIAVGDRR
jgi:hypothetical protein